MQKVKRVTLLIWVFSFLAFAGAGEARAQVNDNLRIRTITCDRDTVRLDTLSIIPGSMKITTTDGKPIGPERYTLDHASGSLIWNRALKPAGEPVDQQFVVTYRVFPFLFTQKERHKVSVYVEPDMNGDYDPSIFSYKDDAEDPFKFGGLDKSGSISRGVAFGNNQDVVVNSSLNLQLSGRLSEDVGILAAITDNNIPIQPEGNTQQIQEFDKVYIQLFTKSTRLTAGDFELGKPPSYFMNLKKKAQGGLLTSIIALPKKNSKEQDELDVSVSGAVSKGKYTRNTISGVEGNQGPYKLTGSNGETYIIVLAGSEKVYIDGVLLVRGADNDYVIDYNLGEVTFTPKNLITRDKRIVIEFEYSDKMYARSMYFASAAYKNKRGGVRFNFFSEQDLRNQPVQQELSDADKLLLSRIGDSTWLAVVPNVDSVAFSSNEVLYKMIDTTVNSVLYDSIFVYSANSDSAHYRLGFSNVGQGKGNYVLVQSSANGRVFKWVAPVAGQPMGTHEPVMLLVTPKKSQMYTLGGDYKIGKGTFLSGEVAMSNSDINTFSKVDSRDDVGYAARFSFSNRLMLGRDSIRGWSMVTGLSHDYIQQYFVPIERFRSVEFERDWNTGSLSTRADEQMPGAQLGFENRKNQYAHYQFKSYLKGSQYKGFRHSLDAAYDVKNFFLTINGSYLTSESVLSKSVYFKQKSSFIKKFKWFNIGIREEQEDNRMRADSLVAGSFTFEEYEAFVNSPDSASTRFLGSYKRRYDRLPVAGDMRLATTADDAKAGVELTKDPSNLLKLTATWRTLQIHDTSLSSAARESTLLGRIEFYTRKFHKVVTSNTHYEMGSGLEVKKEFAYVEVPAGQGLYSWTDYNSNGVQELNEFEVAAFSDQANYIRVFTPTNEYMRAYYSQFAEALNIEPAAAWSGKKGFRKFVSRFAIQFSYRTERKTRDENLLRAYNPFLSTLNDTSLLSLNSSMRGTLFFNRSSQKIACEAAYQDNRNKSLLVNGFDARQHQTATARIRWNITRKVMLSAEYNIGAKTSTSDYFPERDYSLDLTDVQPKLSIQAGKSFRMNFSYKYNRKYNHAGLLGERAEMHNAGIELKYNFLTRGSLLLKGNYILAGYNADENNSLAYEMLEGYKKGSNATWSLSYQRNISDNLQLNLLYDGRQTAGNKMVHVGSVQLRAYF